MTRGLVVIGAVRASRAHPRRNDLFSTTLQFDIGRTKDRRSCLGSEVHCFHCSLLLWESTASAGDASVGMASFYPGIRASGEFTAAHGHCRSEPAFASPELNSGRSVIVRINDGRPSLPAASSTFPVARLKHFR